MALIECPNCGKTISDKARRCPKCGESVPEEMQENEQEGVKKDKLKKVDAGVVFPEQTEQIHERRKIFIDKKIKIAVGVGLVSVAMIFGLLSLDNKERKWLEVMEDIQIEQFDYVITTDREYYEGIVANNERATDIGIEDIKDERVKKEYKYYKQGIEKEKSALEYYESNTKTFFSLWREGQELCDRAILNLYKDGYLNLSNEIYGNVAISHILCRIEEDLYSGKIKLLSEENKKNYYPLSIVNDTLVNFENVEIEMTWNGIAGEGEIKDWKSGETWKESIVIPNLDLDVESFNVEVQIKDYTIDSIDKKQ